MRLCYLLLATSLIACVDQPTETETAERFVLKADGIANEYVVIVKSADATDRVAARHDVGKRFSIGFSARMAEHEARALAEDPDVLLVEQNAPYYGTTVQTNATSGLDRIDQRNLPLDGTYNFSGEGAGVTVF